MNISDILDDADRRASERPCWRLSDEARAELRKYGPCQCPECKEKSVTITDEELARLEALARRATPGTHEVERFDQGGGEIRYQVEAPLEGAIVASMDDHDSKRAKWDAELFAEAREATLVLVAEVRESRRIAQASTRRDTEMLQALRDEVQQHRKRQSEAEAMYAGACVNLDALRAENERLHAGMSTAVHETERYWSARVAERVCERDAARAEAAELRASLADAVGRMGRMGRMEGMAHALRSARVAMVAEFNEYGWGSDEEYQRVQTILDTAIDAYEASLPGLVGASPGGGDAP